MPETNRLIVTRADVSLRREPASFAIARNVGCVAGGLTRMHVRQADFTRFIQMTNELVFDAQT